VTSIFDRIPAIANRALASKLWSLTFNGPPGVYNGAVSAERAQGATTLTLGDLSSGFTGVATGDTFQFYGATHTISASVATSGVTIPNISFTPALGADMAAGTRLSIARSGVFIGKGYTEPVNIRLIDGSKILAGDWSGLVLTESLVPAIAPKADWTVVCKDGVTRRIVFVRSDPANATWTFIARA
jgi:hypothetical protein